jgi:heme/copper-type cytochrome/quinol oxidase subunit 2
MATAAPRPPRGRWLLLGLACLSVAGVRSSPGADGLAPPPEKTIEVSASRSGFTPSLINGRKGEAVHLRLTSRDQEHCFAIEAFRIEKRVVPGRTTAVDITPDRAGTFPFYCCLESGAAADTERGRMVVSE